MNVTETIKAFGCHDVISLDDKPNPGHLDYLDLLKATGNNGLKVNAVAEFQARPLLYIVSANQLNTVDQDGIIKLQQMLANRGERAYLGIVSPGELNVYPINLARSVLSQGNMQTIRRDDSEAPLFFQNVINGLFELDGLPSAPDYVFDEIHTLLSKSSKTLIDTYHLNPLDVLSFLGRALFFRFLLDRRIVRDNELGTVCPTAKIPADCFCDAANSIATCRWLDETFNGDLLPFSGSHVEVFEKAAEQTQGKLFSHLQAIIEGWEHVGNEHFQGRIDWGDLDFAHIPIGVLSQVYESFSRVWDSQRSENTSVYYTPKNIARYLVDDAFAGLSNKKDAHILDPSCGAGIFLVLTFRKLVAARWEADGKRPDTKTIQDILYKQLSGFDVSESALRLAALSLYITAIELNDSPRPPKSLMFPKPLQGRVLFNHRRPEEHDSKGFVLGSLRPDLPEEFNGRFDLVIGNPPWSRLKGEDEETKKENKSHNAEFTSITRRVLQARGLADVAQKYSNPDNNPDLPFLWKSTEWAKPGGIIAMALPGRIFLKQTPAGTRAFNAILKGLEISGILNGSNLSDTAVWPRMNQPFMLFFARNRVPVENHHFHFITPYYEKALNDKGRVRIDYHSAQPITAITAIENTWFLKTLAVGTALDVEVLRKLEELNFPNVAAIWSEHESYSGLGYNLSPNLLQYDATFMYDLPDFTPPPNCEFAVDVKSLPSRFKRYTAHMPRCIELYSPLLLIIPESPGSSLFSPKSWIVREPTVFSKSYYGFSAYGSNNAGINISLLHLITHSELFRYHILMTSSRMGAERRTFLKENLENFPFPALDQLTENQRKNALNLSWQLETAPNKPWREINEFIFDLYCLDIYARQVINDTLEVAPPYKEARQRANNAPSRKERDAFHAALQCLLAPSFAITDETVSVDEVEIAKQDHVSPWYFFTVSTKTSDMTQSVLRELIAQVAREANKTGCSRVIVHEEGCLLVGIIGQYRYWTLSRSRLCALDILRNHLDVFPVERG